MINIYQIFEQLPSLIYIKDLNSRYLYSNKRSAALAGFKNPQTMTGLTDHSLRCDASEIAESFIKINQKVIKYGPRSAIAICNCADEQQHIFFEKAEPFYNNLQELIGVISNTIDLTKDASETLLNSLPIINCRYTVGKYSQVCYELVSNIDLDEYGLTSRQFEVLFYYIRSYTSKEIARVLNISARTVDDHLSLIKLKLGLILRSQIVEWSIHHNLFYKFPHSVL